MRGGDGGVEDRAQERASVGHGFTAVERQNMQRRLSIRLRQKKTPAGCCGGERCILFRTRCSVLHGDAKHRPVTMHRVLERSASDVTADDVAEQLPFLTLEPLQLKLAKRRKVG